MRPPQPPPLAMTPPLPPHRPPWSPLPPAEPRLPLPPPPPLLTTSSTARPDTLLTSWRTTSRSSPHGTPRWSPHGTPCSSGQTRPTAGAVHTCASVVPQPSLCPDCSTPWQAVLPSAAGNHHLHGRQPHHGRRLHLTSAVDNYRTRYRSSLPSSLGGSIIVVYPFSPRFLSRYN